MLRRFAWLVLVALVACGGSKRGPAEIVSSGKRKLPPRTPPPSCVHGALVTKDRVCGLGIAGKGFYWNDEGVRNLAKQRAARNLAGMLRTIVSSTVRIEADNFSGTSVRWNRYLEVDDALVESIEKSAKHEIWFDVKGEGPFKDPERTYDCACMSAAKAGIVVDTSQAAQHAIARQYPVNEVPEWINNPKLTNRDVHCAVAFQQSMYHPEEMYEPLAENIRTQLMGQTRSWVLSEFSQELQCREGSSQRCKTVVDELVEAVNEGISRGVVLTAVWLDAKGRGPQRSKQTAYGWGCVFDRAALEKARERLAAIPR